MTGSAELRAVLDELEDRLRGFGAPIADAFRPGSPPERVRSALAAEGLLAHDDLVTWWGWHDGAGGPAVASDYEGPGIYYRPENTLVVPWHTISLADAVRIRRWLRDEWVPQPPDSWVPVLDTDGAGVLCADAAAGGAATLHIVDEGYLEPPPPQFASLAEFVELVLRLFGDGLVQPYPEDPRVPWLDASALEGDLRRLCSW